MGKSQKIAYLCQIWKVDNQRILKLILSKTIGGGKMKKTKEKWKIDGNLRELKIKNWETKERCNKKWKQIVNQVVALLCPPCYSIYKRAQSLKGKY